MKFSVCMPVYGKENASFLYLSLNSILVDQSVLPDEVVIVEDGELSIELNNVLDYFETKFNNLVRIKISVNVGMGQAMQLGLSNCKYDWIARMDSDDIAVHDRFEKQISFLINNPSIDVIGGSIEEFDTYLGDLARTRSLPTNHKDIIKCMKYRNPINHMTSMFRKQLAIESGGYWSERYFEDYNLWYEMQKKGAIFYNLNDNLVFARIGNNMIERRRGFKYYCYERLLLNKFLSDNFISNFEYIYYSSVKFFLRLLPLCILQKVYSIFLRKQV